MHNAGTLRSVGGGWWERWEVYADLLLLKTLCKFFCNISIKYYFGNNILKSTANVDPYHELATIALLGLSVDRSVDQRVKHARPLAISAGHALSNYKFEKPKSDDFITKNPHLYWWQNAYVCRYIVKRVLRKIMKLTAVNSSMEVGFTLQAARIISNRLRCSRFYNIYFKTQKFKEINLIIKMILY